MKMIFNLPFGEEQSIEVISIQYELDEDNIPIDIIVMMSEEVYNSLEDLSIAVGPWNANKIEPLSDDWLLLYGRGRVSTRMTAENQTYYEVLFSRLKPFKVHNPNGTVSFN